VTRLGLDSNASTYNDMTLYPPLRSGQALPTVIDYEADRFQHLEYDEAAFRTEAGAILGEYTKGASNPGQKLYEVLSETAYKAHPYAHTVIGYLDDIKQMPAGFDYSREFFPPLLHARQRHHLRGRRLRQGRHAGAHQQGLRHLDRQARRGRGSGGAEADRVAPRADRLGQADAAAHLDGLAFASASDIKAAAVQNLLNAYLFGADEPASTRTWC